MPRVPEHRLVSRVSRGLIVKQELSTNLGDSAVLIRMQAAGVCGTDVAMLSGSRPCRAEVLGHEGVGVVISAPVHSLSRGTRVIINPVHREQPEMVIGHSRDGIFREMFWLDSADAVRGGFLVECPRECTISSTNLALAEPLASVLYSLELLRGKNPASLLIRGSGTIAILAANVWSTFGKSNAVLVSKSEAHARWLRETIRWPSKVQVRSPETIGDLAEPGRSAAFDAAILCSSRDDAPSGLHFLMDSIHDGATIDLMAGFPADYKEARLGGAELDRIRWNNICGVQSCPPNTFVDQNTGKSLNLVGHRGTSAQHILQAVEMLSRKTISLADIPHKQVTLEELPTAISDMLSPNRHRMKWVKAIVAFAKENVGDANGRS